MDLANLSAVDTAKAIRDKKLSSAEATQAALDRLTAVNADCNSVITFEPEDALSLARAIDGAIAKGTPPGLLAGVPIAHKDMFDRAGKIASWGARIRADKPAERDATVLQRLKAAGTVQIAALHMTEFAFGPTGHNYVIGHCRNPWDTTRITGGSSSGSGVSVAAGAIPTALGSDTGGSLRLPAAANGIASLKPTWSRVSRAGAMPLSASLDCVGPLARDVRDIAAVMQAMAGQDAADGTSSARPVPDYAAAMEQSVKGRRIGIDETLLATAHPEIQARIGAALKLLEKAGCVKVAVRFPDWQALDQLVQLVQLPEVAATHAAFLRKRAADYGPQVRARVEYGHFISAADYLTAMRARGTWLARTLSETYAKADVTLLPVIPDPLPTIADLDVGASPQMMAAMARMVHFTRTINYLGLPALTLPLPRDGKLPNGFQLVGRPFAEGGLLALGRAYQRELPPEVAKRIW